jgi:hypothetical protein
MSIFGLFPWGKEKKLNIKEPKILEPSHLHIFIPHSEI